MTDSKHPCAVCPKPINKGLLMCMSHWRLVPTETQRQVFTTYRDLVRAPARPNGLARIAAYRQARDAAIAAAQPIEAKGESL